MSEKELKSGIVSEPPMFRGYDRSSCQSTGRRLILSGLIEVSPHIRDFSHELGDTI